MEEIVVTFQMTSSCFSSSYERFPQLGVDCAIFAREGSRLVLLQTSYIIQEARYRVHVGEDFLQITPRSQMVSPACGHHIAFYQHVSGCYLCSLASSALSDVY